MDVRLPDGTVIKGVPDGMSKADLTAKLAKNGYDVSKLGGAPASGSAGIPQNAQVQGDPGPDGRYASGVTRRTTQADLDNEARLRGEGVRPSLDGDGPIARVLGPLEAVATAGSGIVNTVIGNLYGMGKSVANGQYGTPEGIVAAKKTADQYIADNTYQPRSATGKSALMTLGDVVAPLEGLQGVGPVHGMQMAAQAGSGARMLRTMAVPSALAMDAQDAAMVAGGGRLRDLVRTPKPAMPGVGAAETAEATLRAQRFANMRAEMKPTEGILNRSFDQIRFEREAAKRPEGKALNDRYADLNTGMGRHMDALVDETGATASSARAAGKTVVEAAAAKKAAKKLEIKKAYDEAREAGDMAELVDVSKIAEYIEKNRSAMRNAPILATADDELARLAVGGKMSINDLEEVRKMVGKAGKPNAANANAGYTPEIIKIIDDATIGKGGAKYQQARRVFENYAGEFKNREVMDKLLRTKRGTKDRAVAYEDVFDHVVMDGSLDDMKHAFRVLEAHPVGTAPEIVAAGKQAARELRGAAATRLKDRMFSNAGADTTGNVVGSEAKIKGIVNELDKTGKLDYLFGKKGAEEIRDTVKVATDIYTNPVGTVNTSNTASRMEQVLDKLAGYGGDVPVVGSAIKFAAKRVESRNVKKKVDAALNPKTLSDMTRNP